MLSGNCKYVWNLSLIHISSGNPKVLADHVVGPLFVLYAFWKLLHIRRGIRILEACLLYTSTLRHLGSYLQGHPDMKHIPGIDMSSGSLGQGISAAVGMALGAKLQNKAFRVYTLLGDGEIQEGQVDRKSVV